MANRAFDWLTQAEHDLAQAEDSRTAQRHDWACFAAHQSAKKSIKALHLHHASEAWGHVLVRLLNALPPKTPVPAELVEAARVLDNHYIPTRYPNGHAEGPAFEHYGHTQSQQAINGANAILEFVRSHMA